VSGGCHAILTEHGRPRGKLTAVYVSIAAAGERVRAENENSQCPRNYSPAHRL
jgi:hypothetical protein